MTIKQIWILVAQLAYGSSPATMTEISAEQARMSIEIREAIARCTFARDERIARLRAWANTTTNNYDNCTWTPKETIRRTREREIRFKDGRMETYVFYRTPKLR